MSLNVFLCGVVGTRRLQHMHTAVVQLHKQQPMRLVPHAKAANSSFDAEDDLDTDLAEELSRFRTPDTWNKVAQHLDLVWKIGRVCASTSLSCTRLTDSSWHTKLSGSVQLAVTIHARLIIS